MIDYFSIALTHGLIALAAFRLLWRDDLDADPGPDANGAPNAPNPARKPGRKLGRRRP